MSVFYVPAVTLLVVALLMKLVVTSKNWATKKLFW